MPEHLISVAEAAAILQTIGASKETIARFKQQAGGVLAARPALGTEQVIVTSLYGTSGKPGINLQVGEVRLQMDVKSAQKVGLDVLAATEAAISDASVMKLLVEKLGVDEARASRVLLDLREIRQGSRDAVFHQ